MRTAPETRHLPVKLWQRVITIRRAEGKEPLRFGVVHPFSGHAYELRYWLAATGIDPDRDVEITVLPPPLMPDALLAGRIDGLLRRRTLEHDFRPERYRKDCDFQGRDLACQFPKRCSGLPRVGQGKMRRRCRSLIRALIKAADWCANWDNAEDLAHLLAAPDYLDCAPETCIPALTGKLQLEPGLSLDLPRFLSFAGPEGLVPDRGGWPVVLFADGSVGTGSLFETGRRQGGQDFR